MTHPTLTPAHDFKCLHAAVGTWGGSGWQVREDQSDPAPEVEEAQHTDPDDELLTEVVLVPVDEADDDVETAPTSAPNADITKKG